MLRGPSGVGFMAVQITSILVIATCGTRNIDFVKNIGAHDVIDYPKGNGEVRGKFDVVLDCAGGEARRKAWRNVKKEGVLVSVAEPVREDEASRARGLYFIVKPNGEQLEDITEMIEKGELKPGVDNVFPLKDGAKAFEELAKRHARGKIVLEVGLILPISITLVC